MYMYIYNAIVALSVLIFHAMIISLVAPARVDPPPALYESSWVISLLPHVAILGVCYTSPEQGEYDTIVAQAYTQPQEQAIQPQDGRIQHWQHITGASHATTPGASMAGMSSHLSSSISIAATDLTVPETLGASLVEETSLEVEGIGPLEDTSLTDLTVTSGGSMAYSADFG